MTTEGRWTARSCFLGCFLLTGACSGSGSGDDDASSADQPPSAALSITLGQPALGSACADAGGASVTYAVGTTSAPAVEGVAQAHVECSVTVEDDVTYYSGTVTGIDGTSSQFVTFAITSATGLVLFYGPAKQSLGSEAAPCTFPSVGIVGDSISVSFDCPSMANGENSCTATGSIDFEHCAH